MSFKNQSSRIALLVVMVLGLLLAFGVNVWPVIGPVAGLLIIVAAMILIFTAKFPGQFVALILKLVVGPVFFCYLFSSLPTMLRSVCGPAFSKPVFWLFLLGLMIVSFLFVRWQIRHFRNQRSDLQTNERKPLPPIQLETTSEVNQCVAFSSSRESSGED
jgi:membrane-bound ClpP family serine protease